MRKIVTVALACLWMPLLVNTADAQMILAPQTPPGASSPGVLTPVTPEKPKARIKRANKDTDQKQKIESSLTNDAFPKRIENVDLRDRFFDGQPIKSRAVGGREYTVVFHKNGKAERFDPKTNTTTPGTWRLKGEGYCSRWNKGREDCFTAVQDSGVIKIVRNTRAVAIWSREQ